MRLGGICLDWRVLAGLGIVALGIWVVAPGAFVAALPLLAVLACLLSMLIMMRGMRGKGNMGDMYAMNGAGSAWAAAQADSCHMPMPRQDRVATQAVPLAALSASAPPTTTREAQLAALRAQVERARVEQDALARAVALLTRIGAPEAIDVSAVREVEATARAADDQLKTGV